MLSQITLKDINDIAIKAGKSVLEIYNQDFKISYKDDNSPLSEADLISNEIICKELAKFSLPILSEENKTLPPVLGVVYAPALDLLYSAKKGEGAFKNSIKLPLQRNENSR